MGRDIWCDSISTDIDNNGFLCGIKHKKLTIPTNIQNVTIQRFIDGKRAIKNILKARCWG